MNKSTNPDWPDPTDWANRLHERLEAIGTDYLSESWEVADDPEQFEGLNKKQALAAEAIVAIHNALRELPSFEKSKGGAALHDVAGALRDVVMGGNPRLFTSVRPGRAGTDGLARIYLRFWVVFSVRLLVEAFDLSDANARATVAKIFANAGATGRQKSPLSASTIRAWCERTEPNAANSEDVRTHSEIEAQLKKFQDDPNWPGRYVDAVAWIEKIASDPLLSSKYG